MCNKNDRPVKKTKLLAFIPEKKHTGIYSNYS